LCVKLDFCYRFGPVRHQTVSGGAMMAKKRTGKAIVPATDPYDGLVSGIAELLDQARGATARAVNGILTATYWEVGRRIVEFEQGGQARAVYGDVFLKRLGTDLTAKYGRGFSRTNLQQMRLLYLGWSICQTPSGKLQARVKCSSLPNT